MKWSMLYGELVHIHTATKVEMSPKKVPCNARPPELLAYIDAGLSHPAQAALLAVAAGIQHPKYLSGLPGLANASRKADAIESLVARNYVVREPDGTLGLGPTQPTPTGEDVARVCRRAKVQRTLNLLDDPHYHLRVRSLSGMADALAITEAECLTRMVLDADRKQQSDRVWAKYLKRGRMAFVRRRVPAEYCHPDGSERPRRAPADAWEKICEMIFPDEIYYSDIVDQLTQLYRAVMEMGETELSHFYRIVEEIAPAYPELSERWERIHNHIRSYLTRRWRPQPGVIPPPEQRKRLIGRYPVPDIGYGYWVPQEIWLCRSFRRQFEKVLPPEMIHILWIQAHTFAQQQMEQPEFAVLSPDAREEEYQSAMFRAAIRESGLPETLFQKMEEGTATEAEVKSARAESDARWAAYQARCRLRQVLRFARDFPPQDIHMSFEESMKEPAGKKSPRVIDLSDNSSSSWAPSLLWMLIQERMGQPVDQGEFERRTREARSASGSLRSRTPKLPVEMRIRRFMFKKGPIEIPDIKPTLPVATCTARIKQSLAWLGKSGLSQKMLCRGQVAIAELFACRQVVLDSQTDELCTLREAVERYGPPSSLWQILRASGLTDAVELGRLEALFGLEESQLSAAA